jgi:imidazoleglycerol-phosphate dehydratase
MREAQKSRKTKETEIFIILNIDGQGNYKIDTGIPFFDHMLELFTKHGLFDLEIKAQGDTEVDFHHTVEDIGIVLGETFKTALGDKKGIRRYGSFTLPMDEAIATTSIDLSGRPFLAFRANLTKEKVGEFDAELIEEFFKAFSTHAMLTMHIHQEYGTNLHHKLEAIFKSFAKALDHATQLDIRQKNIPSTKGVL